LTRKYRDAGVFQVICVSLDPNPYRRGNILLWNIRLIFFYSKLGIKKESEKALNLENNGEKCDRNVYFFLINSSRIVIL